MLCKLCHRDRELKESHIFPELLHTALYDDKHRAWRLSQSAIRPKFIQKGIREKLLCAECERHLDTSYENDFARFWYQTAPLPTPASDGPYELSGYDYVRFKLFHLSILWRASVATSKTFEHADLGPHESRLRRMINDQDAGKPEDYPVFAAILVLPDTKVPCDGIVMPPIYVRGDGQRFYAMIYGGCVWNIAVGSHPVGPPLTNGMLTPQRLILPVWDIDKFKPIRDMLASSATVIQQYAKRPK